MQPAAAAPHTTAEAASKKSCTEPVSLLLAYLRVKKHAPQHDKARQAWSAQLGLCPGDSSVNMPHNTAAGHKPNASNRQDRSVSRVCVTLTLHQPCPPHHSCQTGLSAAQHCSGRPVLVLLADPGSHFASECRCSPGRSRLAATPAVWRVKSNPSCGNGGSSVTAVPPLCLLATAAACVLHLRR
jgi:hypothetical protein